MATTDISPQDMIRGNKALASFLGVHPQTVQQWRKTGVLDDAVIANYRRVIIYDKKEIVRMSSTQESFGRQTQGGLTGLNPLIGKIPASPNILKQKGREEFAKEETYNALISAPLCLLEVAWDLTDSVCDMLSLYRIDKLKKVCRMLRQFHEDYRHRYEKNHKIERNRFVEIQAWCNNYLETTNGDLDMTKRIDKEMKALYPDINIESKVLILSAYKAWIYFKAIISHTEVEELKFARKIGLPNFGHMLPSSVYGSVPLLEAIFSDIILGKDFLEELISEIKGYMKELAKGTSEPTERTEYRMKCIAFICNKGCREQAVESDRYGCYASSMCKRMVRYDKKHNDKK